MPTYDYRCTKCGHRFELFHSMTDESVKRCPKCKGKAVRVPAGGAGLLFKGSGFYITDYRSKAYRERAKQEKSGGSESSGSGKSGGSESGGGSSSGGGASGGASPGGSGGTGSSSPSGGSRSGEARGGSERKRGPSSSQKRRS